MSGSPKYSRPSISQERQRQIIAERLAASERERARREQVAEEKRLAQLNRSAEKARRNLLARQEGLSASLAEINTYLGQGAAGSLAQEIQAQLDRLGSQPLSQRSIDDAETLSRRIVKETSTLVRAAQEKKLEVELNAESTALDQLTASLHAMPDAMKYDSHGFTGVVGLLKEARRNIASSNLAVGRDAIQRGSQLLAEHQEYVAKEMERVERRRAKAQEKWQTAKGAVEGMLADQIIMRWNRVEVEALNARLDTAAKGLDAAARSEIAEKEFQAAEAGAAAVLADMFAIEKRSQEQQIVEDQRQYVLTSIMDVMTGMGFKVGEGYPALTKDQDPTSEMVLVAERIGGGTVAISVPQQGDIWYDVDGYEKLLGTKTDGSLVASCDKAEDQIQRFHQELRDRFDIEMSPLHWEHKDPDRIEEPGKPLLMENVHTRQHGQ